jgi:hypothetical protein
MSERRTRSDFRGRPHAPTAGTGMPTVDHDSRLMTSD